MSVCTILGPQDVVLIFWFKAQESRPNIIVLIFIDSLLKVSKEFFIF